ncbi:hypothetical protein RJ639_014568 [Escallonia herrerae]|uniref:Uncharacterized protein n=1 Tax=Escallonia herrerae TaxID=1293975 RepID=A0AA88VJ10_9ASTE|nr:hypothetical protein RJ639_014568 [Escallonia herrerae]
MGNRSRFVTEGWLLLSEAARTCGLTVVCWLRLRLRLGAASRGIVGRSVLNRKDGNEIFSRIKKSTQLKELVNANGDSQSVEKAYIAFLFYGCRLRIEQILDEGETCTRISCKSLHKEAVSTYLLLLVSEKGLIMRLDSKLLSTSMERSLTSPVTIPL